MSDKGPETIASVEELLTHALALETESAERYRDLADNMEVHNNEAVARLFEQLQQMAIMDGLTEVFNRRYFYELAEIDLAKGLQLPDISPWDYKWTCPEGPESACTDEMHYLMTTCDALKVALHNEIRARDFYAQVAAHSPDPDARAIAAEMA